MKFSFTEKHIVIIFCALFFLSALYLFWQNGQELNPNQGKSWWVLSFTSPTDSHSLVFIIENHSDTQTFHYQILQDKAVREERDISVPKGSSSTVTPNVQPSGDTRTKIIVTTQTEKKEIYR